MLWMDDAPGRRAAIERAWALAKIDGRTRYVVCLEGWPVWHKRPSEGEGVTEWAEVDARGRVEYRNKDDGSRGAWL